MNYLVWLWNSMRRYRFGIALRVLLGTARVFSGLLMVWLSKRFIDETIHVGSDRDIVNMVIALALTVTLTVLLRQAYIYLTSVATVRASNQLRLEMFQMLFKRKLFQDADFHSGDISSRFAKDIETITEVTMDTFPQMTVTTIQLLGAFLLLRFFDPRLAWVLLLLTPVTIAFGKIISRKIKNMTIAIRESESRIQTMVQEGAEFNMVLRSLGSRSWMERLIDDEQSNLDGRVKARARFTMATRIIFGLTLGLGYLFAFIWGGIGLRNGLISFGVMTSFLQLVGQIQYPIFSLLNMGPKVIHATAGIDRLRELEKQCDTACDTEEKLQGHLGVRIENLQSTYAKENRIVINKLDYDFKPGTRIAVMGKTGAGKTTLLRLMLAFIKPTGGRMLIYNEDEVHVLSESTRCNFTYVPQGNSLLSGSIRHNLLLAKPTATDEELQGVLHDACADFVFDLPSGIDTNLSERAGGLSEGQAQRIAIARSLLCPGNIVLFDEISSALDEETERELYRRLFDRLQGKTVILITHRVSVAETCDEILKMPD